MTNSYQDEPKDIKRLRIARRSMMYVVRSLLLIILAVIVCIGAFLTAERYANLYILTSEGMAIRAECVFADGARNDLGSARRVPSRRRPGHLPAKRQP